ncbi:hypothetical protein ES705_48385 [subsurface metagenome]
MDSVADFIGEKREDPDRPSEVHTEPYFSGFFNIAINGHIELHKEGLSLISKLPDPNSATEEDKKGVFKEIAHGNLEHWFQEPCDNETLGKIAVKYL